ncbi:flagellar hook-length control protein FliK [Cohnella soli]|uniref:Flagellar hook-length control protein FliK n=1 Tax=Cohnella soli TaxID=425005 RepID=A0ABW0HLJ9_9BACL
MNMAINTTPVAAGKTSSTGTGANASVSTTGNAFAGALVQAIDGKGNQAPTNGTLSLPVGLAGLFAQVDGEEGALSAEQLMDALAKLADQLGQIEQDGADKLPEDVQNQLASMLVTLQSLIVQTNAQPTNNLSEDETNVVVAQVAGSGLQGAKSTSGELVASLRKAVQALSDAIASGADIPPQTNGFVSQLQQTLNTIVAPTAIQAVDANVQAKRSSDQEQANKEISDQPASQQATGTSNVASGEQRKSVLTLREPVWRFNLSATEQQANAENGETVVAGVSESEATTSDAQPAWTLVRNDTLTSTQSAPKADLPASVPVQQFAEQMEKFLVKQFQLTQGNGTSEAKLSLTPEHLGQVDIRIVMHNGQVTAQFVAESAMAKDMLENQMSQLKASLSSQGLSVERLEVVQQPSTSTGASFMQQQQRQSNSGNGNGSNRNGSGDSADDQAVFAAEMERTSFMREFGQGGSINVTA